MRFDLLDEYGTLVPFGLGVSKDNRVLRNPDFDRQDAEGDAPIRESEPMSVWTKFAAMLGRMSRRKSIPAR